MPRPFPSAPNSDLAELLRQCLAGLVPPVHDLSRWLDRYEVRR